MRTRNFALDCDRSTIIQRLEPRDNPRKIHSPLTNRDFLAKVLRVCRPKSVLGMNPLHVRTKDLDGINRVGLAVENEIGEIEVDALIVEANVLDGANESDGSFLAGFIAEVLAVALAVG